MRIEVKNLTYTYSEGLPFETTAVHDVSFTVESGSFTSIIGHTGSGKSTLAEEIMGLMAPTSGDILLDGESSFGSGKKLRRKIGMVFQYPEYQLFEEDVLADVMFGPRNLGLSDEECKARAAKALCVVGIEEEKWQNSPFSLSGGEKRRVAIAGVLAMEPTVLILDEPTAGLDPFGRADILDLIKKIKIKDITIILVSHDMDAVAIMSDHVIVMDKGHLIMDGSPSSVFARGKELKALGLALPAPMELMNQLKERGIDVPTEVYTTEEAVEILRRTYVLQNN